jgi:hypothetical protein
MTERKGGSKFSGNQGEGNREAAHEYNEEQQEFVEKGRVEKAAEQAKKAVDSEEGKDLERAERKGKDHAKDVDPNVKRDY